MNMPRCLAVASCLTLPCLAGSLHPAKMTPCRSVNRASSLVAHTFLLQTLYLETSWS